MAKILIFIGLILIGIGLFFLAAEKFPEKTGWIGKLPGDLYIEKKNVKIFFPLTTSLLISLILSLIFWFLRRK